MTGVIGLLLFAGGVYLLASETQGSAGSWSGFALVALGFLVLARSGRRGRRERVMASRRSPGRARGARRSDGGGDGRTDNEGEGDGDGGGGDGGD